MSTNKHLNYVAAIFMLVAVVFVSILSFKPDLIGIKPASNTVGYEKYFDEASIMTVDIIADDADWQTMLEDAQSEEYIKCDVIIDGERINNVGIRPKGNSSLQQVASSNSDRYSLKIEFDHYVKNQTFHGLDKLVLNNTQADATYMKEFMSYEIFESAGVAVPLHSYAQIKLNGVNKGFYLAIEAVEEAYAVRVYGSDYGKLYKPESVNMGGGFGAKNATNEFVQFEEKMSENTAQDSKAEQNTDTTLKQGNNQNQENNQIQGNGQKPDVSSEKDTNKAQKSDVVQNKDNANMEDNSNDNRDFPLKNFNMGQGMMGNLNSGGTNLVYTDDETSSYSAVFDSAVFDTTEQDFSRVIKALKNLNSGTELEKYINVEATLRYFAAQTFIINFDSYYGTLQHNYYLYEKDGQLTMLPWDLNLAFAGYNTQDASTAINYPIDTPLSDATMEERPMLSKLLEVPKYMAMYHKYLKEIVTDYIDSGDFSKKISDTNTLIKSYVENDSTAFYSIEEYEEAVPVLEKFGLLRAESISSQLTGVIPSTEEGQTKDSTTLVDTGDLNIKVMGSQGGDGAGGKGSINGNMGGGRRMMGRPDSNTSPDTNSNNTLSDNASDNKALKNKSSTGDTSSENTDEDVQMPPYTGGFDNGDMPQPPSDMQKGGYPPNMQGDTNGQSKMQGNLQQPGMSTDKNAAGQTATGDTSKASETTNRVTKTDLLSFGVLGGVSVLGLLFVCLWKRKKFNI